jgi:4-amino-4-deoxy-L-arabinose transferase-like glycosyltransferase
MPDTTPAPAAAAPPLGEIGWKTTIHLLDNRFLWWDYLKAMVISGVGLWLVVAVGSLVVNEGDAVLLPWGFPVLIVAIFTACWVIACLVLGNGYGASFAIDEAGVRWSSGKRERAINRAVAVVGALAGSASTAGVGLLADSEAEGQITWARIRRLNIHPGPRVVSVRNGWRVVVRLYVPEELWDAVVARLQAGVAGAEGVA